MKNKDILRAVRGIEDSIRESESRLNNLIALLIAEEVIDTLHKWKTISTAKLQREFRIGYASSARLIDSLLEKGLIVRKGDNLEYNVVKKK